MDRINYKDLYKRPFSLRAVVRGVLFGNSYFRYIVTKIRYGKKVQFFRSSHIGKGVSFEGANKVFYHSSFQGSMGFGSFIGPHCEIGAYIGRFTSIAPWVRTNPGIHPIEAPYVSTCPMFFSNFCQNGYSFTSKMAFTEYVHFCVIGSDVWVQENVFFTAGITIGDGAVVMAGAVVVKDVPPYAVVGGCPAKVIKYRYSQDVIDFLLKIQWWNRSIEWIKAHADDFNNIECFIKRIEEEEIMNKDNKKTDNNGTI